MKRVLFTANILLALLLASCGKPQGDSDDAKTFPSNIIGGERTTEFKAVVALIDEQGEPFCTGFIIDKKTVGTAAHCLTDDGTNHLSKVFVGSSITNDTSNDGEFYPVDYFRIANQYRPTTSIVEQNIHRKLPKFPGLAGTDFGYIVLQKEIDIFENEIVPIITEKQARESLNADTEVIAVGFGYTQVDTASATNMFGKKHVVQFNVDDVFEDAFLADEFGVKSVWIGDSGGPIYYRDPEGNLAIVGISSRIIFARGSVSMNIGSETVAVYTRADIAIKWIRSDQLVYSIEKTMSDEQQIVILRNALALYPYNSDATQRLNAIYLKQNRFKDAWDLLLSKPDGVNSVITTNHSFIVDIWKPLINKTVQSNDFNLIQKYCKEIINIGNDELGGQIPKRKGADHHRSNYLELYRYFMQSAVHETNMLHDVDFSTVTAMACFDNYQNHRDAILRFLFKIEDKQLQLKAFRILFMYSSDVNDWIDDGGGGGSLLHTIAHLDNEDIAIDLSLLAFRHVSNIESLQRIASWKCDKYYTSLSKRKCGYRKPHQVAKRNGYHRLAALLFWGPDTIFTSHL